MAVKNCWVEFTTLPYIEAGALPNSRSPVVAYGARRCPNCDLPNPHLLSNIAHIQKLINKGPPASVDQWRRLSRLVRIVAFEQRTGWAKWPISRHATLASGT